MPPLSLLIKPSSSLCNLRCKYCFYHSIAENRVEASYGMMSIGTLEILVQKALSEAQELCAFNFQGGEPTLVGIEFYRKLIEFEKKYNINGIRITNSIQTNGTLIDEEFAQFLAENQFLVGISLDGTKEIHDENRIFPNGKGTYNAVMKTIGLFDRFGVEYNILFVVNAYVARHAKKVYQFFKKNNFRYLQFIPCLDPLNESPGRHEYSLTPERFERFLKPLFDHWYEDFMAKDLVSVRTFDNYVGMMLGYPPESCSMAGKCTCYCVVEANGNVYPCDFYVIDQWLLGNIKEQSFMQMIESEKGREFVEVSTFIDEKCKVCKWFGLCRGGCRRNREPFLDGKPVLNYLCTAYYNFFEYAVPKMHEVAQIIARNIK